MVGAACILKCEAAGDVLSTGAMSSLVADGWCCWPMFVHREMERREKVEEARRETERILAEQEADVARRKVGGIDWGRHIQLGGLGSTDSR